jgi:hypothetical protein
MKSSSVTRRFGGIDLLGTIAVWSAVMVAAYGQSDSAPYFHIVAELQTEGSSTEIRQPLLCDPGRRTAFVASASNSGAALYSVMRPDAGTRINQVSSIPRVGDVLAFNPATNRGYVFDHFSISEVEMTTGSVTRTIVNLPYDVYSHAVVDSASSKLYFFARRTVGSIDLGTFNQIDHQTSLGFVDFMETEFALVQDNILFAVVRTTEPQFRPLLYYLLEYDAATLIRITSHTLYDVAIDDPNGPYGSTPRAVVGAFDPLLSVWYLYVQGLLFQITTLYQQNNLHVSRLFVVDATNSLSPLALALTTKLLTMTLVARNGDGDLRVTTMVRSCDASVAPSSFEIIRHDIMEPASKGSAFAACVLLEDQFLVASDSLNPHVLQVNVPDGSGPLVWNTFHYPSSGISQFGPPQAAAFDEAASLLYLGVLEPRSGLARISTVGRMQVEQFSAFPDAPFGLSSMVFHPVANTLFAIFGRPTEVSVELLFARLNPVTLLIEATISLPITRSPFLTVDGIFVSDIYIDPTTAGDRVFFDYSFDSYAGRSRSFYVADINAWNGTRVHSFSDTIGNFHSTENVNIIPGTFEAFVTTGYIAPNSPFGANVDRVNLADFSVISNVFTYDALQIGADGRPLDTRGTLFIDSARGIAHFGSFVVLLATNMYRLPIPSDTDPRLRVSVSPDVATATLYVSYIAPNTDSEVLELVHVYNQASFTATLHSLYRATSVELAPTRRLLFVWTTDNGGSASVLYKVTLCEEETLRHAAEVTSSENYRSVTSGALESCLRTTGLFTVALATAIAMAM